MKKTKGFTLIELLIVIGIIAILAAIIYVAVDPARRLSEARNAERWSSVNAVLNGVLKYTVDNAGTLPPTLTVEDTGTYIVGSGSACNVGTGCGASGTSTITPATCIDLDSDLVPTYLASIPFDPSNGDAVKTDYYIYRSAVGRITVGACDSETVAGTAPTVSVSR